MNSINDNSAGSMAINTSASFESTFWIKLQGSFHGYLQTLIEMVQLRINRNVTHLRISDVNRISCQTCECHASFRAKNRRASAVKRTAVFCKRKIVAISCLEKHSKDVASRNGLPQFQNRHGCVVNIQQYQIKNSSSRVRISRNA